MERESIKTQTLMKPKLKEEREKENFWNNWRPTNRNNDESTTGMEDSTRMDKKATVMPTNVKNVRTILLKTTPLKLTSGV